ncbi:MAG: hypothetical protein ABEJ27_07735 [Halodesulfurarchaeum sp.]
MTHALVVGPEGPELDQLVGALRDEDVLVDRSGDAPSALARFEDLEPDVVLSLDSLPDWSGLRLLRHVNRRSADFPTFLLLDGDGAEPGDGDERGSRTARAQMTGITTVDFEAVGPAQVVEMVLDAMFEEEVDTHRDRRRHLAVATAKILREAMGTLSRATNYRDSSDLLKERVIATTREVIWDALSSNLLAVPGYSVVWVARYDPDGDQLVPQDAAGIDSDGLRQRQMDEYVDDIQADLRAGEVVIRENHDHTEAIVPLPADDGIHGTVHVYRRGRGFPSVERDRLGDIGRTVGTFLSALERIRKVSETQAGTESEAGPEGDAWNASIASSRSRSTRCISRGWS